MSHEGHWRIAHSTPGRAVSIPLPESITEEQIEWLRANIPRAYRIVRPHEQIGNVPRGEDTDNQLESLRSLTAQITEKKIELLRAEQQLADLKLEAEKTRLILEERKKHAKSFAGALTDVMESLGTKFKL
jgi:hypothetical protein